jgi:hypothetical protein
MNSSSIPPQPPPPPPPLPAEELRAIGVEIEEWKKRNDELISATQAFSVDAERASPRVEPESVNSQTTSSSGSLEDYDHLEDEDNSQDQNAPESVCVSTASDTELSLKNSKKEAGLHKSEGDSAQIKAVSIHSLSFNCSENEKPGHEEREKDVEYILDQSATLPHEFGRLGFYKRIEGSENAAIEANAPLAISGTKLSFIETCVTSTGSDEEWTNIMRCENFALVVYLMRFVTAPLQGEENSDGGDSSGSNGGENISKTPLPTDLVDRAGGCLVYLSNISPVLWTDFVHPIQDANFWLLLRACSAALRRLEEAVEVAETEAQTEESHTCKMWLLFLQQALGKPLPLLKNVYRYPEARMLSRVHAALEGLVTGLLEVLTALAASDRADDETSFECMKCLSAVNMQCEYGLTASLQALQGSQTGEDRLAAARTACSKSSLVAGAFMAAHWDPSSRLNLSEGLLHLLNLVGGEIDSVHARAGAVAAVRLARDGVVAGLFGRNDSAILVDLLLRWLRDFGGERGLTEELSLTLAQLALSMAACGCWLEAGAAGAYRADELIEALQVCFFFSV